MERIQGGHMEERSGRQVAVIPEKSELSPKSESEPLPESSL